MLKLTWTDIYFCRRKPFFLSNRYLKQGIGSVYGMIDLICNGYLELWEARAQRELQNENFLNVSFESGIFRL